MRTEIQHRSFPLETKVDTVQREIEGYASTWDTIDVYGERVVKGAFKKSIKERFKNNLIKVLWQHREPLGLPVEIREDDKGLYTRSRISRTQLGDDALTLIGDGVVDRMSIGFRVVREDEDDDGVLLLKEVTLYEYSPVTFAANEDAVITAVKSLEEAFDRKLHSLEEHFLSIIEEAEDNTDALHDALHIMKSGTLKVKHPQRLGTAIAALEALLLDKPMTLSHSIHVTSGTVDTVDGSEDLLKELTALRTQVSRR